jgi:hypothetical protein
MPQEQSPLLRIPSEIRLMIYELLFNDNQQTIFEIRNEDPDVYKRRSSHARASYRVLGRDLLRQSRPTTYYLVNAIEMHTALMRTNRKIYEETAHVLYGNRIFSFGRDIEAIVPFFSDLSKQTRPLIHEISLTKQGSVYARDFDRCEWTTVCEFLKEHMQVGSMNLVVEGGRPSLGWNGLPKYSIADFKTLCSVRYEALDWVWELLSIRGIKNIKVGSEIHHCPPSHSSAMAFFAAFSASIETGFADFLRSELVVRA